MNQPRDAFPDLELPDHAGNPRRLSELVAGDPTVLHCYRGWWCPKEQRYFRRLLELQEEAEVAYVRIVSLSVDPPEVAAAYRAGLGARWTFLCDQERHALARARPARDDRHEEPPVRPPRLHALARGLRIHAVYDGYWYSGRATLEELRQDLRAIQRSLRTDWDAPTG